MSCGSEEKKVCIELGCNVPSIDYDNYPGFEGVSVDSRVSAAVAKLRSGELDFTGWVDLPAEGDIAELKRLKDAAKRITASSQLLVVIGIGGSYLGAKAVIEALNPDALISPVKGCRITSEETKVMFAGCNLSAHYHKQILAAIENCETSLCVISKSGTTTESAVAFAVFKEALVKKYGEVEARTRIYAITDDHKGTLREEADREGYTSFGVPADIGGRYSVLSPVGLLPIAVAGIDVEELLAGAAYMREEIFKCEAHLTSPDCCCGFVSRMHICTEHCGQCEVNCVYALKYAMARYAMSNMPAALVADAGNTADATERLLAAQSAAVAFEAAAGAADTDRAAFTAEMAAEAASSVNCPSLGTSPRGIWPKTIEVFEYYEPRLATFAEWLKQLFGESEGKEGQGIFPASLSFSADLHSMGQFLQQGRQCFFETVIDVKDSGCDLQVPDTAGPMLGGRTYSEVERAALEGVIAAHEDAGIPVLRITVPDFSAHSMGQMIYFFEINCAVTAMLSGVDPFNQPGVEDYKSAMRANLTY